MNKSRNTDKFPGFSITFSLLHLMLSKINSKISFNKNCILYSTYFNT